MEEKPDWFKLETLVAEIQATLAPDAEIIHNVRLPGADTERSRQIDVLVRKQIGQYTINIVIDCKDYKTAVDVKGVEAFDGLVRDVRAHQGVLVCPAGFTASAKKLAKKLDIALYRPVHTGDHKWKAKVTVPAVCEVRTCRMSFGITMTAPYPLRLSTHPAHLEVFTEEAVALADPLQTAVESWNNASLPDELGVHRGLNVYPHGTMIDNGYGMLVPIHISLDLYVERERYFGDMPITKISGFQDAQTGHVIANAFRTELLDWQTLRSTWARLDEGDAPPRAPAFEIRAYQYLETLDV